MYIFFTPVIYASFVADSETDLKIKVLTISLCYDFFEPDALFFTIYHSLILCCLKSSIAGCFNMRDFVTLLAK